MPDFRRCRPLSISIRHAAIILFADNSEFADAIFHMPPPCLHVQILLLSSASFDLLICRLATAIITPFHSPPPFHRHPLLGIQQAAAPHQTSRTEGRGMAQHVPPAMPEACTVVVIRNRLPTKFDLRQQANAARKPGRTLETRMRRHM